MMKRVVVSLIVFFGIALCSQAWGEESHEECVTRWVAAHPDRDPILFLHIEPMSEWCARNPPKKATPKPCHWEIRMYEQEWPEETGWATLFDLINMELKAKGWEPFQVEMVGWDKDTKKGKGKKSAIIWLRREVCQ